MSFKASLFLHDKEYTITQMDYQLRQHMDATGRPNTRVFGGLISLTFAATSDDGLLYEAMFSESQTISGTIVVYKRDGMRKDFEIKFANTYVVSLDTRFNHQNNENLMMDIELSALIMEIKNTIYESPVNPSNPFTKEVVPLTTKEEVIPRIQKVYWVDSDIDEEEIEEISYGKEVSLVVEVENPEGSSIEIIVEKEDGTEFENEIKQLTFSESLDENGIAAVTAIEIKEKWEEFKTSDVDKLVAKVIYIENERKSSLLKIKSKPKVIVNFRPNSNWRGEFGFDWLRMNDTKLFGDTKYGEIVSKQYKDNTCKQLEKNSNAYKGFFKNDAKLLKALKKEYKSFSLPWATTDAKGNKTPDDYIIPWLSFYKNQEVQLELQLEIEAEGDYLEFESNSNFSFNPTSIDITGKKGKIKLKDNITIKCLKEFAKDETILINACQKNTKGEDIKIEAGKITVWANDASKRKEKKVVFVQIQTPPMSSLKKKKPNSNPEKNRIEKYLKQALIKLHKESSIVDLNISENKNFLDFIKNKKVTSKNIKNNTALDTLLKKELSETFKKKYDKHFKAFYFAENGYHSSGGLLSGYSRFGADFVVVFASANEQTASHEFLHSMNLAHSFSNSEASKHAVYTYQYKKTENLLDYSHHEAGHSNDRCSLWYWQWVKANFSIK